MNSKFLKRRAWRFSSFIAFWEESDGSSCFSSIMEQMPGKQFSCVNRLPVNCKDRKENMFMNDKRYSDKQSHIERKVINNVI